MYTILIAEDEQLERQALRYIIEKNYSNIRIVGEAGDGASAVHLAVTEKPDIVLMDIRMPELNGLEAARSIKVSFPETIVIMLTAFDEFNYAKQALTIGVVEYLLKPLRPDALVRTLDTTLEKLDQIKLRQQEEARLRKNLKDAMPFIQMSFVYDLISGNITELEHIQERAVFLGMKAQPGVVILVDIDNFKQLTHSETELRKQLIKQNVFRRICDIVGDNALVTPFGSDDIIILMGSADTPDIKFEVLKTAGKIRDAIAKTMGISITIGIGKYYNDPRDMQKSYTEAVNAKRQRFYLGDNQIIDIEDIPHLNTGPFYYPFNYERTLMDNVRCGDRKQAKTALKQLLNEIFSIHASIETVKACVLELLIVLSRSAVEGGANLEQLTLMNFNCLNQLIQCTSKEQVYHWMLDAMDRYLDNMLENRSSINSRAINKACDYIVKNCHRNISLEEVSQSVHLSPFYFSRLFKQEKGCNFVELLTKARVDKAKGMLQNPDYTIVRIASEVGYQDPSYFCRVFRQEVGMTPNQYRSELRKDKTEVRPEA